MPERIEWRSGRLRSVRDLTPDIRLFEIEPSGELVVPTPGSHINVTVQIGDRPDLRSYSMVGPCDDGLYRIAVKLLPDTRGGSAYMWSLVPGARLTISTPGNHFELGRGRPEYLLLAGGIGITPIYTMTLALAQAQANFRLLYACRRRQDVAFGDELRERIGDRLQVFLDEEGEKVDLAAEIERLAPGGEFYVCGPIGMLEAAKSEWQRSGRPVDKLRFETFGNSGRFASQSFSVRIPRLGCVVEVPKNPDHAGRAGGRRDRHDLRLPPGECGLCALDILDVDGIVDHRDVFFSDEEKAANGRLCTCVSRVAAASRSTRPTGPPDVGDGTGMKGEGAMAMAERTGDRSVSQTVKAQLALRELVLRGELSPGERVSELQMVERLGVSRTPVRMALVRLKRRGCSRPFRPAASP